jgi:hypothetical protein
MFKILKIGDLQGSRACGWHALLILPDQDVSGVLAWKKTSDGKTFMNPTTADSDSIVGVNLNNGKRTNTNQVQFLANMYFDVYKVVYLVVMRDAVSVGTQKRSIDARLTVACKGQQIGPQRDIEEHVSVEDKGTGRKVSKRLVRCRANNKHCRSERLVNQGIGGGRSVKWFEIDEGANDLTNCSVRGFNNGVGRGCMRRNFNGFYAGVGKRKLKIVANKLGTVVVYNLEILG